MARLAQRLVLTLALGVLPLAAGADIFDDAKIDVETYPVTGGSLDELIDAMLADGPQGYWAYTTWHAMWDADCNTDVSAKIIMPELREDAPLTAAQIEEFARMSDELMKHELGHVQIGLDFADAVAAAGCPADTSGIHAEYMDIEAAYDEDTQHGQTQGVTLIEP